MEIVIAMGVGIAVNTFRQLNHTPIPILIIRGVVNTADGFIILTNWVIHFIGL